MDARVGIAGFGRLLSAMRHKGAASGVCPLCGWTSEDYRRTGLLGCGLCYTTLSVTLPESLEKP